jgi:hypothetical protein
MNPPHIDSYRFGSITIDGETYTKDVIILPGRVIRGWWRQEGHSLHPADLEEVLAATPATLIVGQGTFGRMRVSEKTMLVLEQAGIELIALSSKEACEEYNQLRGRGNVAAALHLTC